VLLYHCQAATRLVWERMKIVIEPSAGTGMAVCLAERYRGTIQGKLDRPARVGVVFCGGNTDFLKVLQ
jgi:threonine dehydratase